MSQPVVPRRRRRWRLLLAIAMLLPAFWLLEAALDSCWPYPLAELQALPLSQQVLAADGSWLRVVPTPAGERALAGSFAELPPWQRAAVLLAEDSRFDRHGGVDAVACLRALVANLASRRVVSGASTLTMQVVRLVEPRPRTLASKLRELLRARQLERCCSKAVIADVWLQQVPMGGTLRGLPAAARYWFGRPLAELVPAEFCALLAMVPAPSARHPQRYPQRLLPHRDRLLQRLAVAGWLLPQQLAAEQARALAAKPHHWPWLLPELVDLALAEAAPLPAAAAGSRQLAADLALDARLRDTLRACNLPADGHAVVVLRQHDGAVLALLGDQRGPAALDLARSPRSLGSTLKPLLYALLHDRGGLAGPVRLADRPLQFADWQPSNFQRGHAGWVEPAQALSTSNNITAVLCLETVGVAEFRHLLQRLGLPPAAASEDLTAALGTGIASPLQLARAYQRFVADPAAAGLRPDSVLHTLRAMRQLPLQPGDRAGTVAWKSGTSAGRRDAWCVGIDAAHVVVVWLGNRDGAGHADLVGARSAAAVLAAVLPCLPPAG